MTNIITITPRCLRAICRFAGGSFKTGSHRRRRICQHPRNQKHVCGEWPICSVYRCPIIRGTRRPNMPLTLTIDLDKRCAECGKPGATGSGICLACATKAISGKAMLSAAGKAVQQHWKEQRRRTPHV